MAAALLGGCQRADPPDRDGSGAIAERGDLPVNQAQVGDCFDQPEGSEERVETLAAVPCLEPHDREVFHRFDLAADRYPGSDVVNTDAAEVCLEAFATYVGLPYADSVLDAYPVVPTRESWDDHDDRTVLCVLAQEGGRLTGSQEGAAR